MLWVDLPQCYLETAAQELPLPRQVPVMKLGLRRPLSEAAVIKFVVLVNQSPEVRSYSGHSDSV